VAAAREWAEDEEKLRWQEAMLGMAGEGRR
jgi:hypothetical protein